MWLSRLKSLRVGTIVSGVANVMVVIVGGIIIFAAFPSCDGHKIFPIGIVSVAAGVKFCAMIKTGMAQEATAKTVLESAADTIIRHERRMRYRTWLWWTRFAIGIAFFQVVGATYLMFNMAKYVSDDGTSSGCILAGVASNGNWWMKKLLVVFVIMVCFVALVQCFLGSDVLRWRSFYATQDDVWRAHYHEVFNHGIREILCCFGRIQYLTVSEEDEIYSVAKLLGDLVSYRASGTGHLELLAGLALLQRHSQSSGSYEGFPEAPQERLKEGAAFHKFAEAAYTGPLLDVGRNPILFPCAWLYRQGVLSPWTRSRRPTLDGDNWWRGHAAAFLKYVKLSPNVLQRGRVNQEECKAAYFILVLHHLKSVVIAVRGTETPEDLITDGLGRECLLSAEDLDGLMNNSHIHPDVKQSVESSSPHYGHRGIVEAARELYMQVEGNPINDSHDFGSIGFLSSLLGARCECDGYNVRLVGHSLGGSIATLLGLRLYGRFPNLHVYAYGALPCVDSVIANACTEFITSIVHENEFSARLSVRSIMRLRASAIMALTQDTTTDTALIFRLARRFLYASKYQISRTVANNSAENHSEINIPEDFNNHIYQGAKKPNRECSLLIEDDSREDNFEMDGDNFVNPYHNIAAGASPSGDPVSCLMETVSRTENGSATNPTELFLPGLIIHVVLQQQNSNIPLWASWRAQKRRNNYKAFIANRENFTDIVVSPSMFLDHMPWRCYHAMQNVLEARAAQESQAVVADEPRIL